MRLPNTLDARLKSALEAFLSNLKESLGDAEVYLFGSAARGDYLLDSDVDVIVVTDLLKGMRPWEKFSHLRALAPEDVGFDIICYSREEFKRIRELWRGLVRVL